MSADRIPDPDLHQKLCDALLGDSSEEEKRELEQALAADPRLRTDRDRLLATVSAVRDAFPEQDGLSSNRRDALLTAALQQAGQTAPARPVRSSRRTLFATIYLAAAAALLVCAAAWLLVDEGRKVRQSDRNDIAARSGKSIGTPAPIDSNSMDPRGQEAGGLAAGDGSSSSRLDLTRKATSYLKDFDIELKDQAQDTVRALRIVAPDQSALLLDEQLKATGRNFDSSVAALTGTYKGPSDGIPPSPVSKPASGPTTPGPSTGPDTPGTTTAVVNEPTGPVTGGGGRATVGAVLTVQPTQQNAPASLSSYQEPLFRRVSPGSSPGGGAANKATAPVASANPEQKGVSAGVSRKGDASQKNTAGARGPLGRVNAPVVLGDDPYDDHFGLRVAGGGGGGSVPLQLALADGTTIQLEATQILEHCRRQPQESPSMMFFRFWGDNPFVLAALDPFATFAADVDTASYALARNYLNRGLVPEKAQIRTEEFINYFPADLPAPVDTTFALQLEAAPSLFGARDRDRWLLRVALRGKEVALGERPAQRLTFVIDTSGSMKKENRLDLVKHALRLLLTRLDERDEVAIVNFSTTASLCLPMTPVKNRGLIEAALFGLTPHDNTNAEAGLKLGYEQALAALALAEPDGKTVHRLVLFSDGVANVGVTDQDRISNDVAAYRKRGIYLNTVGVGMGNHNDVLLEQLADKGDGLCNYVDTPEEAQRALVDRFASAFVPIARDVKIQVEFDPKQVLRHRLLGYENRAVADADFRNDAVDAGEIGAGHQVCALFELEMAPRLAGAEDDSVPFATARVRWLPPYGSSSGDAAGGAASVDENPAAGASEIAQAIDRHGVSGRFEETSTGYRRSTLVAQFAEFLRRSAHSRGDSLDLLLHQTIQLEKELNEKEFSEFCALVRKSRELILTNLPDSDPLTEAIDAVRRNAILRAELKELSQAQDEILLEQMEQENQKLEQRIKELLEQRLRGG